MTPLILFFQQDPAQMNEQLWDDDKHCPLLTPSWALEEKQIWRRWAKGKAALINPTH